MKTSLEKMTAHRDTLAAAVVKLEQERDELLATLHDIAAAYTWSPEALREHARAAIARAQGED